MRTNYFQNVFSKNKLKRIKKVNKMSMFSTIYVFIRRFEE